MTKEILIPTVSKDLLEYLQKVYPEQSAEPSWTEREIWMRSGERRLVRNLAALYAQQNENILGPTLPSRRVLRKSPNSASHSGPSATGSASG